MCLKKSNLDLFSAAEAAISERLTLNRLLTIMHLLKTHQLCAVTAENISGLFLSLCKRWFVS